jgi:hypothetical protein
MHRSPCGGARLQQHSIPSLVMRPAVSRKADGAFELATHAQLDDTTSLWQMAALPLIGGESFSVYRVHGRCLSDLPRLATGVKREFAVCRDADGKGFLHANRAGWQDRPPSPP